MADLTPPKLAPLHIPLDERIEVAIPSRGRTINLVCLLQALRTQTFRAWDLTILDDNPDDSLKGDFTLNAMLKLLETEGHRCRVIQGEHKGLPHVHNTLLHTIRKTLIARIDDDTLPDNVTYLAELMSVFHSDESGAVAAVGGPIPELRGGDRAAYLLPDNNRLSDYAPFEAPEIRYLHPAGSEPKRVTTLYSSFIYKRAFFRAAGGYSLSYSTIAEKEETDMLLRVAFLGGRLIFHPDAVLWHLRAPMGGIRHLPEATKKRLFDSDYQNFVNRVKAIKDGTFDWNEEREQNERPFEKYRGIGDDETGYIVR